MIDQPHIENGFASVTGGSWLVRRGQPAACNSISLRGLKGFVVPDRFLLQVVEAKGAVHAASSERPFLTQVSVTDQLKVVTAKVLLAPLEARSGGQLLRVIPLSFRHAFPVTKFSKDWVVLATRSRVRRFVVEEDEILTVRSDAAVAWTGKDPTGFCPKLRMRDLIFPVRHRVQLALNFYGPQIVWVEGCNEF